MRSVKDGEIVTIRCVGKLDNGMIFTDSTVDGPITFKVGHYNQLKGLNDAVVGMTIGELKTVILRPQDAFGEYDDELMASVQLEDFPEAPEVGMQVKTHNEDGSDETIWTIKEIREDEGLAILDGNHILAGKKITFNIELVSIQ